MPIGTTGLVSYWKLDEASGNRADAHGTDTLTEFNGVDSGAGLVYATAANFDSVNNEILIGAGVNVGNNDFTWVQFIRPDSVAAVHLASRGAPGGFEWLLEIESNSRYRFRVASGTAEANATATVDGGGFGGGNGPSVATWSMVVGYHDGVNDKIGICSDVNSFTRYEAAYTFGVWSGGGSLGIGSSPFYFPIYYDGRMGPSITFSRLLSDSEILQLWNGGAGLTYAALAGIAQATMPFISVVDAKRIQ